MNETTERSVLSVGLTRLKSICLLPFCTYALGVMQFNDDIALMYGEVLLKRGAGRSCKDINCWPPLFQLPSHPMNIPQLSGMKPLHETTEVTAVLWLGL